MLVVVVVVMHGGEATNGSLNARLGKAAKKICYSRLSRHGAGAGGQSRVLLKNVQFRGRAKINYPGCVEAAFVKILVLSNRKVGASWYEIALSASQK